MKAKLFILGMLIFIISISNISGNSGDFYNISFNSEDTIMHMDIKDNDVVYFTRSGNIFRADMNSNKSVLLDSIGSKISLINSSGNMVSILTDDKKIFVFNHDKKIIYKFVTHQGLLQRVIIDDKGYLTVITLKDISAPKREWLAYVYSPSGDLIAQNVSDFNLTSFISLDDKLVFGTGDGEVLVYDHALTLLWKNNVGKWVKEFQHYKDSILLTSENSVYSLSYKEEPKLSKILSLEDFAGQVINDNSRIAVSSTEGCLYIMGNDVLQNQFSFNGNEMLTSCQKKDMIKSLYLLGNKTLVFTDKGKVFVIEGNENKLLINKSTQITNNFQIGGYLGSNGKLYIISLEDHKLEFYSYENVLNLEKELNEAKSGYQSFLNKTNEEKVPTFDGASLLKTIESNHNQALSYWETGDYQKSKESLDKYTSGVKEYLSKMGTKSTNVFSIILIVAVLILAVIGIVLSRRKKSVECSNCGYILKDYWSHCPKCGEQKGGR